MMFFEGLRKAFPDAVQLQRLLQLEWMKDWPGWSVATSRLDTCTDALLKAVFGERGRALFFTQVPGTRR